MRISGFTFRGEGSMKREEPRTKLSSLLTVGGGRNLCGESYVKQRQKVRKVRDAWRLENRRWLVSVYVLGGLGGNIDGVMAGQGFEKKFTKNS